MSVGISLLSMQVSLKTNQMNNQAQDETMAKTNRTMMIMMPLMPLGIGFTVPAGLSVYWIAQYIFTIFQEIICGKLLKKDYEAARAAAAERERQEKEEEKRRKEELALESMSRLMKVAEDCGVLYCCEVVNRFEQYLLNTAKEGVEFVKRLGSPNARVLLDTFHMNIEEDSMVDAILEAGPWLGHFHVGENNRRPAGSTNRLPWKDMAAALKQVNYQGAIVMEPFVLMGGTIPYDIKVWRDLSGGAGEAGLDEMAGRACRFLKELTA